MNLDQIVFIIAGAFTVFVGVSKFGMNSRQARRMNKLFGESGARIIYIVFGIALIAAAFTILK